MCVVDRFGATLHWCRTGLLQVVQSLTQPRLSSTVSTVSSALSRDQVDVMYVLYELAMPDAHIHAGLTHSTHNLDP